jgi:hypothetical protein
MGMKLKAVGNLFNGGGSGYVLNRVALQQLVRDAFPRVKSTTEYHLKKTDLCPRLQKLPVPIHPIDTVDALGRQRFHGMDSNFIGRFDGTWIFQRNLPGLGQTVRLQGGYRFGVGTEYLLSCTRNPEQDGTTQFLYESSSSRYRLYKAVREARTERTRQSQAKSLNSSAISS